MDKETAGREFLRLSAQAQRPEAAKSDAERAAQHAEQVLADHAEVRRLEREERGEILSLVQELLEAAQSTHVAALRWRRLWEILGRRREEITFAMIERGDGPALWANAFARGERWDEAAQAWLPTAEAGIPSVTLRRLDSSAPFTFKTAPRGLSVAEAKASAKAWSAADPDTRGPDPQGVYRKVRPAPDGTFSLPWTEALKCWREHKDTHIRARNRKLGNEKDRPVVSEVAPAALWTPPEVLGGAA